VFSSKLLKVKTEEAARSFDEWPMNDGGRPSRRKEVARLYAEGAALECRVNALTPRLSKFRRKLF
jgi:hypothetical protein